MTTKPKILDEIRYVPLKPEDKKEAVKLLTESFADSHLFKLFFGKNSAKKAGIFFDILTGPYMRISGLHGVYTPEGELVSVSMSETDRMVELNWIEKLKYVFRLGIIPAIRLISYTYDSYRDINELKGNGRYIAFICIKKEYRSREFTQGMFADLMKGYPGLAGETTSPVNARAFSWYGVKVARTRQIGKITTYFLTKTTESSDNKKQV
jgi:hypothetical protein